MKQHLARYLLGSLLLLVLLAHSAADSLLGYRIDFISRLDAIIYDTKLRLTMPRTVDSRVVIVDVDEKSLAEQGRWPWGRDKMAALVQKLFEQQHVSLIGFDVVFAEPDNSSGLPALEALAQNEMKGDGAFHARLRELRPRLDNDARFAETLKGRPVLLGYYFSNRADSKTSGTLPPPVLAKGTFGRANGPLKWSSYGGNLAQFQANAAGGGHFNPDLDFDGISRRVPLIAEYAGEYYEALSLAMVRLLLGSPPVVPGIPADKHYQAIEWLDLPASTGTLRIPVDAQGNALIPYRGHAGSFRYVSATDVLKDRLPVDDLKGKIILVGTSAPGLNDLRATPVGEAYPGVEIHANLIAGMLDGNIKHKPDYVLAVDLLLLLLAGTVMVVLLPLLSPARATLVTLAVLFSLIAINAACWILSNMVIPLAGSLILIALLFALNMSWGYFVESRSKRQFTELFGQYVPPELVDEMAKNPQSYTMAGRKAQLSVLFSDVRGFTTISEALQPDELATLMNEYLGAMTAIIRRHRGTLDKYIGDAIMAFWGAPLSDPEHARHAVMTALEMQQALVSLNQTLIGKGWPELRIGVGVNTGAMTVGDMGSPVRKAYTVMGDAVNLGSRLEGITKQYGVGIIVGEDTYEILRREFVFREIDRVRVKGKDAPVSIYEPLGTEGSISKAILDKLRLWQQALRAYRSQDWDQAELTLFNLTRLAPHPLYALYAERVIEYRKRPPGEGWNGVTTFDTK